MSNMKLFGSVDKEAARKAAEKQGKTDWLKLTTDAKELALWRVLPPLPGRKLPFEDTRQHFIQMPGADKPLVFICLRAHDKDAACPGCELVDHLLANSKGGDKNEEFAKKWKASYRGFLYAVDRREPEKGVRPFGMTWTIRQKLLGFINGNMPGLSTFYDADSGVDLYFSRTKGDSWGTDYDVIPSMGGPTPLAKTEDQLLEWLGALPEKGLLTYTTPRAYDEIKGLLAEQSKAFAPAPKQDGAIGMADVNKELGAPVPEGSKLKF